MVIHACDVCGQDIQSYATWIEVPLGVDNPRIAIKHPASKDTTILHLQVVQGSDDFDICAACFRDAMRRYLAEATKEFVPAEEL